MLNFFVFVSKQQLKDVPCFCQAEEMMPDMQEVQNVEKVSSLNSEGLRSNDQARHTEQTPKLQKCTVKLVDFRRIQGLNAKTTSKGKRHTGGNDD